MNLIKNLGLAAAIGIALPVAAAAADLRVKFVPRFNGAPLVFDSLTNQIAAGQKISVTRLDFLLSNFALHRADGAWIGRTNWFAFISAREGRADFELSAVPAGKYDRIRFHLGVEPAINHADAARWPANHPLNPEVNGLYWGWSHEYIFLALEGRWNASERRPPARRESSPTVQRAVPGAGAPSETAGGYSYHLATDRQLMTVELPVELDLSTSRELLIAAAVDKIFSTPNAIELSDATDTTHSRTNDDLAGRLRENIEHAFAVISSEGRAQRVPDLAQQKSLGLAELAPPKHLELSPTATPYRFTFADYFPRPDLPRDNPLTGEGVALGGRLFFDRRLSRNNSQSCAACHHPRAAFSDDRRFSRGAGGEIGGRNAMPLLNLAWKSSFFWDGRAATLREQVLQPIQNPIEMHESLSNVVAKLQSDSKLGETDYPRLFANAFGSPEITADKIARALEQFLLVQVSFDSKFDRAMRGEEKLTDEEQRGMELFHTEYDPRRGQFGADCFHCHGGPLFQSQAFANNGLDAEFRDPGRYAVTKRDGDRGKFAVPSLRNVAVTGPYMHDGRFRTLEEVVEHYATGVKRSDTLDPNIAKHPDGGVPLSAADKKALVAFLKTLTDNSFNPPPPRLEAANELSSSSLNVASGRMPPGM